MRIFLGNAPWYRPGYYGVRAGSRWPHFEPADNRYMPFPFFMAYAAARLEAAGHQVTVCDGIAERLDSAAFYQRMMTARPELLLLEVSTASISSDLQDSEAIKQQLPGVPLAVAGPHSLMFEPDWLTRHPAIDYILTGEYEVTLAELAGKLANNQFQQIDQVAGLLYRTRQGTVIATGRRELIADLDAVPWPARHLLPMDLYCDTPGDIPQPSVQMWGSRGCPFQCNFCVWPQVMYGGNHYRVRSAAAMADEFEQLVRTDGYRSVYFDDDTFNLGRERLFEFCRELHRRRLTVPWAMMARADHMDHELLTALRQAGLQAVKYGLESANQDIISRCGKELDLGKAVTTIRLTQELGIKTHLTFCFGLPGETRKTAEQTIALALDLNPDTLQFSIATPFPGSRYYEEALQQGRLVSRDFSRYDGYTTAVVATADLTAEELEAIRNDAEQQWVARCRRRQAVRQPLQALGRAARHPLSLPQKFMRLFSGGSRRKNGS